MKTKSATDLLDHLEDRHAQNLRLLEQLMELPDDRLRQQPQAGAWNALQAVEHLNIFDGEYLDRVGERLREHGTHSRKEFRSSRLGGFIVGMITPGPKSRKIKTFKPFQPAQTPDRSVLHTYRGVHDRLTVFLEQARTADLKGVRVDSFLTTLVKLPLGDTLKMLVYHDWRHLEQACRAAGISVGHLEASEA